MNSLYKEWKYNKEGIRQAIDYAWDNKLCIVIYENYSLDEDNLFICADSYNAEDEGIADDLDFNFFDTKKFDTKEELEDLLCWRC